MSSIQQVEQVAVEDGAWQQWRLTDEQAREAAARIVARDKASRQGIDTVVDIARFGSAVQPVTETVEEMTTVARVQRAAELDVHVDYYERAAGDISQALEYVEDTGTEAAVALRATQRTMSSVATALRRRAADLRGEPVRNLPAFGNSPEMEE